MDYKNIYYKIIENAKKETDNGHRQLGYFEKHHILPKSLGGSNDKENLVKLTAREHFICHWLLVKMYDKGTTERYKMLCALWRMNNNGAPGQKIHYINSHAYEALRIEYAETISKMMCIKQAGKNNSQFGKVWYTNIDTGESKPFKDKPNNRWIKGRNLFRGESELLRFNAFENKYTSKELENMNNIKKETEYYWDLFHKSNCSSIMDFCNKGFYKFSRVSLILRFKKYIPYYKKFTSQGYNKNSGSNPDLVGIYQ